MEYQWKMSSPIIIMDFSESNKYLAVSVSPIRLRHLDQDIEGGYVEIFDLEKLIEQEDPENFQDNDSDFQDKFSVCRIDNPMKSDPHVNVGTMACQWLSFSQDEGIIMVNFQVFDNFGLRENHDKEKIYVVFDLTNNKLITNWDILKKGNSTFTKFQFPNHINGKYKFMDKNLLEDDLGEEMANEYLSKPLIVSSINEFNNYLFMGCTNGELCVALKSCLYMEKDTVTETLEPDKYCQAKNYSAHASFISQIEIYEENLGSVLGEKYLFTTGCYDQAIFQWRVNVGDPKWDADHFPEIDIDAEDLFGEVETKDKYFNIIINKFLHIRNQINELQQNIDTTIKPELELKLEKVIGRMAYNRRNNLFYTDDNNLVFSAGSLIILMTIPPESVPLTSQNETSYFVEKFLEPDSENLFSINPEISIFTLSKDRRYLCAGTIQKKAKLMIWELASRTFIKSMTLANCCVILLVKYSYDSKYIVAVGLTKFYTQCVYFIDVKSGCALGAADYQYSIAFKIKEVEFLPRNNQEFITLGAQHMTLWKFNGG
jgi:hypothetical protein